MTDNTEPLPSEAAVNEATPEQLALARRCAAAYWQTGEASDEAAARRILSGEWDDHAYVQAALAAHIETTERAAAFVAGMPADEPRELIATALRKGDHLK